MARRVELLLKRRILIASISGQVRAPRKEKRRYHEGVLGQETNAWPRTNATLKLGKIQQLYHHVNTQPTRVKLSFWSPCLAMFMYMQTTFFIIISREALYPSIDIGATMDVNQETVMIKNLIYVDNPSAFRRVSTRFNKLSSRPILLSNYSFVLSCGAT
jgi:hypothetical protein